MPAGAVLRAVDLVDLEPPDPRVGTHYELDEGRLIIVGSARPLHELIKANITMVLMHWVRGSKLGRVLTESQFSLAETTARVPDVAYVRRERLRGQSKERTFAFAPDIAIEVISDSETSRDSERKAQQYLAAGAGEVWQFYPGPETLRILTAAGERTLTRNDTVTSPLLPGFESSVALFYEDLD